MELTKKKYAQNEVVEIMKAYKGEYEKKLTEQQETIINLLSQDPRPAYQSDSERVYHLDYDGWTVDFVVTGATVCVKKCARK